MSTAPVTLTLSNTITPAIALEILPKGLVVNCIYLNADGVTHDVLEGPLDSSLHSTPPYKYMNTIVGRYANRVPVTEQGHTVEKNGYSAVVKPVSNESPTVSLHGGPNTLDTVVFEQIKSDASVLFGPKELDALKATEFSSAIFTATIPDGHNGYPGTVRVETLITLVDPPTAPDISAPQHVDLGSILIVYRGRLAEPALVTPINLTQHWGFNLEASLRPTPNLNIRDHYLTLRSEALVAIDKVGLPTGELQFTAGTPHQHNAKRIGDQFPEQGGYDHFYLFPMNDYQASIASQPPRPPTSGLAGMDLLSELLSTTPPSRPSVELWSEKSGYKLQFSSNQGGVQFYTANFQAGAGTKKKIHGGSPDGDGYPKEGAAFLEFHDPLSAFLHRQNDIDSLLTSDELYHHYVKVNVSFKPPAPAA